MHVEGIAALCFSAVPFESGCVRQRKDDIINVERQSRVYLQHGPGDLAL